MKKFVKNFLSQPLVGGSLIMFVGTMVSNFGTYLYHLFMGRMLTPSGYGILESLIAFWYIASVIPGTFSLVIIKFSSQFLGEENKEAIASLFRFFSKWGLIFSGLATLILIILSPFITNFLRLSEVTGVILIAMLFLVATLLLFNRSFLQGILKFKESALNSILETTAKLFLAIVFVYFGFYINGAIAAILLSGLFAYTASLFPLRELRTAVKTNAVINKKEVLNFIFPSFILTLSFISLFSVDIVLVKHFFSSWEAGLYAALSVLGKIIYFSITPIIAVMFPLVSKAKAAKRDFRHIINLTLVAVILISLAITLIYFLLPKLVIEILFGKAYLEAAPLVWLMGVFLSFYSLSYTLTNFYLSLSKTKILVVPLLALGAEIVFVSLFHTSLKEVITTLIAVSGLLTFCLLLYYPHAKS